MKKFILLSSVILCLTISISLIKNPMYAVESEIMLSEVEAITNMEFCWAKHLNGCHAGGRDASSCSIDATFHVCIGGVGGGCSVTCTNGTYACCGLNCECKNPALF